MSELLPETLPDHLRKQFEDLEFTAIQFDAQGEPHEYESMVLWDDVCVLYETLRELIIAGELKE